MVDTCKVFCQLYLRPMRPTYAWGCLKSRTAAVSWVKQSSACIYQVLLGLELAENQAASPRWLDFAYDSRQGLCVTLPS